MLSRGLCSLDFAESASTTGHSKIWLQSRWLQWTQVTSAWSQNGRSCTIEPMPNIASILKAEISRVARKEVRGEIAALKKAAAVHRTDIAALKRRAQTLEQEVRRWRKPSPKVAAAETEETSSRAMRFRAKGLASHRQRLALSADDVGLLVGASGQSVYNWESGKARPRAKHLAGIATLKTMGKKEAAAKIESLRK